MPFLVTPPLPNLTCEIAFDSGFATPEGDRTWTDVSAYVEGALGCEITYGRADELSTPDPNTLSISFDNHDGRFTPAKASSPYYPNVKKGKPIRVTVTYAGVDYVRFTGYVNEWPLVWPDGSSAASTVTVSASSRRARLGQTAPLTSAIRAAYLADDPVSYWPMSFDTFANSEGRFVFRDIMQTRVTLTSLGSLGAFAASPAFNPVIGDGTPGPTDEYSLVKLGKTTDPANPDWQHYVGGSMVTKFGTSLLASTGCGFEMVARVIPAPSGTVDVALARVFTGATTFGDEFRIGLFNDGTDRYIYVETVRRDFGVVVDSGINFDWGTHAETQAAYDRATDGEIHHWYAEIYSNSAIVFLDGELIAYCVMVQALTQPFRTVWLGSKTLFADTWVGHAAAYDRDLSIPGGGPGLHDAAATAATETVEERVVRVAGRVGVPAGEIDVETTIAAGLGPQAEAGRSASEVIDEAATSTGGILYDTRAGHLAMQARNHRYNTTAAFTLSGVGQEIGADLTAMADDRYLFNTVDFSRSGDEAVPATVIDQDSIDEYGVYKTTLAIISTSDQEVEAAAQDILYRFADGGAKPRISQVSADLVNLEAGQRAAVLSADIGTQFNLASLASQAPTDPMPVFYEGATETITATSHDITINTTPADVYQNVFIWDDPVRGKWDSGNVWAY